VWAHAAVAGERARVRVGGGFVPSDAELSGPLLLLAGGIGITPLASIARHAAEVAAMRAHDARRPTQPQTLLVYSCRSAADFALLPQLRAAESASGAALRGHAWVCHSAVRVCA
jgi:ferredoxin-NADP reductase